MVKRNTLAILAAALQDAEHPEGDNVTTTKTTTTTLDFIGKKGREPGKAYAVIVGGNGWTYEILKRYAKDDAKRYARWFANVHGVAEEMGDTYVLDIVSMSARLIEVEGDVPSVANQQQFLRLKQALSEQEGGISIFG